MNQLLFAALVLAASPAGETATRLDCGFQCLAVSLGALGEDVSDASLHSLRNQLGMPTPAGYSLGELGEVASARSLHTLLVKTNAANLSRRSEEFACIASVDDGTHFICILGFGDQRGEVLLFDPLRLPVGNGVYSTDVVALEQRWDGTALLLARVPLAREEDLPNGFPWWLTWSLVAIAAGLAAALLWKSVRRWAFGASIVSASVLPAAGCAEVDEVAPSPPVALLHLSAKDLTYELDADDPAVIRREVRLENRGDAPLVLRSLSSSCACTEAKVDRQRLAPGQSATLSIAIDTEGDAEGSASVLLRNDSANDPVCKVTAAWTRVSTPQFKERYLEVKNPIPPGQSADLLLECDCERSGSPDLSLRIAHGPLPCGGEARVEELGSDAFLLRIAAGQTPGQHEYVVSLHSTSDEGGLGERYDSTRIRYRVEPEVSVEPRHWMIRGQGPDVSERRSFRLVSPKGIAIRSVTVETADDRLDVSIESQQASSTDSTYEFSLTIRSQAAFDLREPIRIIALDQQGRSHETQLVVSILGNPAEGT